LLLPQHEVAVREHLARIRVASKSLLLAKSGMAGVVLWFLVFICLGYMLVNMLGSSSSEKQDVEPLPSRLTEGSGSWAQAYREAQGGRRSAMDLLFRTGIIATQDLSLPSVSSTYIEECVQVAAQMLRERSIEGWMKDWQHAQQTFEDRLSAFYKGQVQDVMAAYEFSDGSWARAYRQSEGQRERREAFELLLRLGIISPDEFADSLVTPKYIEERISVAVNLLKQKPLSQWVDLCETAHGNFRESVMLCFSTQGGGEDVQSIDPRIGQGFSQRSSARPEVRHQPSLQEDQKATRVRKNTALPVAHPTATRDNAFTSSNRMITEPTSIRSPHSASLGSAISPRSQIPATAPSGTKSGAFVLPVGPKEGPRTLPPTSGVASVPAGRSTLERPQQEQWPSSDGSLTSKSFGRDKSPRTAGAVTKATLGQQGRPPAQIKFSSNAIAGSSWQVGINPPGSQPDL